jgi:DNA-binding beta-propeller fold protein YncE
MDQVVDPTGKYLLALDTSGVVHILTIGANAALSQIGTSESVGSGAGRIAIDPSGHFVIVVQASNLGTPAPPDQLTVFTFDPASAAMKKLPGTYPVGKLPVRIAIVSE